MSRRAALTGAGVNALLRGPIPRLVASEVRRVLSRGQKYRKLPFQPLQADLRTHECQPSLYDPDQLSRVTACGFGRTLASEVCKLDETTWREIPTQVCSLEDAVVIGGDVLSGGERYLLGRRSPWRSLSGRTDIVDVACIPNSRQGLNYFGHWLRDDCVAFELAAGYGPTFSLRRPNWGDRADYEAAFGQGWDEADTVAAGRLTLFNEIAFNADKGRRLRLLRGRLRTSARPAGGVVFLARGPSGHGRQVVNENALIEKFSAHGVRIVIPEGGGRSVMHACLDADLIITVEGSQAAHAAYLLREGGSLLIIQPPDRFYNPHLEWARLLGMNYGIVVGHARGAGMFVAADEVLAMTDRLLRRNTCAA